MANHKRRRPKNRRSGCLMCKPHKVNGVKKRGSISNPMMEGYQRTWKQEWRSGMKEREQIDDFFDSTNDE